MAKISTDFYKVWRDMFSNVSLRALRNSTVGQPENPEIIVLTALMLAQKVLHDSPYTTATWSDIVTQGDILRADLNLTERLMLQDLNYSFRDLLTARNIAAVVAVLRSTTNGSYLTWSDVKVMIWKSQARGKVSQTAISSVFAPRTEASGRRYYGPRLLKDSTPNSKDFDFLTTGPSP